MCHAGGTFGIKSLQDFCWEMFMKRIAAFLLLVVLSIAGSMPAQAQRISPQENARQSRKAIKKQQKMLNKMNKKQAKAMKKAAKAQRKAIRKTNRRYKK